MNGYLNFRAVFGQVLVHRVIHDFPHQMVKPRRTGAANVHPGALPDGHKALQHLDIIRIVSASLGLSRIYKQLYLFRHRRASPSFLKSKTNHLPTCAVRCPRARVCNPLEGG
ncbi:hypothetical protein D3C71_1710620 [compost metagenome]